MQSLITEIKNENQDFEFYPTTNEILKALLRDIKVIESSHYYSYFKTFLDIGAGNGKVLNFIKNEFSSFDLYAIEKSPILCQELDNSINIIGTDFYEQSLIDKNIDIIFCNPPYSDFEFWANKIIRENNSKCLYLVIPERWINSNSIFESIKYRNAKYTIVGNFDFFNSEDRKARAIVNLIRIDFSISNNAFDSLFDLEFKQSTNELDEETTESKFSNLILGKDYVKNLVQIYNNDLLRIKKNYDAIAHMDVELLKEFNICRDQIKKLLKGRLKSLKNIYWQELISRMKEITERLIDKNRRDLLDRLNKNGNIDFTESNIYMVILWIIKQSNSFIDSQLVKVYEDAIDKANCINYKSNQKVFSYDRWRYNQETPTHIYLDYRIVLTRCGRIEKYWGNRNKYNLSSNGCNYIKDLLTVANNLNFKTDTTDKRLDQYNKDAWLPGKHQEFRCIYKGKNEVLFEVKAHLNGNIHIKFNQKFALALNVEFGRLKGWINTKHEANNEISPEAEEYFKTNYCLLNSNVLFLN